MGRTMLLTQPVLKIHSNSKSYQEKEASQSAKKDVIIIIITKTTLMSNLDQSLCPSHI